MGKTDSDLDKHSLTTCGKAALLTLVALLEDSQVNERIDVHDMHVCHISIPAYAYVSCVRALTLSDVVRRRGFKTIEVTI